MKQKSELRFKPLFSALLLMVSLSTLLSCKPAQTSESKEEFSTYGVSFASNFATSHPFRGPYSEGEKASGDMIIKELETLGYKPEIQEFTAAENPAEISRNIIVNISGKGFHNDPDNPDPMSAVLGATKQTQADGVGLNAPIQLKNKPIHKILFGTHYGTQVTANQIADYPDYNGIHANASGVAALMTAAKELQGRNFGFDITLVFFGAHYDSLRGSNYYVQSLGEQVNTFECVYILDSIFAGDKLYAHAGLNSCEAGMKYLRRRKLYETTDIALEYDLAHTMGVNVLTNQAGFLVEVPGYEGQHVYREFTLKASDQAPFDAAGVNLVYFESGNYKATGLEGIKESTLPAFDESGGKIEGTKFDNLMSLESVLSKEVLNDRINVVAFILVTIAERGIMGMLVN